MLNTTLRKITSLDAALIRAVGRTGSAARQVLNRLERLTTEASSLTAELRA